MAKYVAPNIPIIVNTHIVVALILGLDIEHPT